MMLRFLLLVLLVGCSPSVAWEPAPGIPNAPPLAGEEQGDTSSEFDEPEEPRPSLDDTLALLRIEAPAVEALVQSPWVKAFTRAVHQLPAVPPRTIYHDADKSHWYDEAAAAKLTADQRAALKERRVDTKLFYLTKYGTPLAYSRPLDLVGVAGLGAVAGKKVFDFGFGTIGHLRLLAALGAEVRAIDVDPFLVEIYRGQAGKFGNGSVHLMHGAYPAGEGIADRVGGGYQLFISKNVLKNGYIHPEKDVPKKQTIDLGVSDKQFVAAVHRMLAVGGYAMIYNITPPPNAPGLKYRTWADGRCPFPRGMWKKAGFEVIAFDVDDSAGIRRQGRALGWHKDVDLETKIFAMYSLLKKVR
jgi:hypothetical protein